MHRPPRDIRTGLAVALGALVLTLACSDSCTFDESGCFACGDGVIDPAQTRDVLGLALAAALEAPIPDRPAFGVFRM